MATTRGTGRTGTEEGATSVGELSYSNAGAELDAIIEEFETGVIDVDRLVDQLERATDIVDELDRRLRRTRMQVEELVPRLEAIGKGEPPEADEEEVFDGGNEAEVGDGGDEAETGDDGDGDDEAEVGDDGDGVVPVRPAVQRSIAAPDDASAPGLF